MRFHGIGAVAAFLTLLVPGTQLLNAQALTASAATSATRIKPSVFQANTAIRGSRTSGTGKAPAGTAGNEITAARSRNSRTFMQGGNYETLIYPGSVNYQDAKGQWQPIDDTLVSSSLAGYAFQNKANSYASAFPRSLGDSPVHFASPAGTVDFSLEGAHGTASASHNAVTYANALPGVTVTYAANADTLKESLRLDSSAGPSSFVYRLGTGAGLTARQLPGGAIVFLDRAEKVQAAFALPYMYDSSNTAAGFSREVRMTLGRDAAGQQTVTLTADPGWLTSSARKFPVVIDPTIWANVNYYGGQDCFIQNTNPNTNFCSSASYTGTADQVGYDGTSLNRTLLEFPVQTGYTHIVPNSNIIDAELDLTLASSTSTGAIAVTANPITQSWNDNYTTWNNRDNATAWSTAGGSFGSALDAENIGPSAGSYRWIHLTQTIQNWVNGSATNYGFLLKASNEGAAGLLKLDNQAFDPSNPTDPKLPHLRIQWNNWNGLEPWYKFESHKLSDRMSLAVNVANGNLVVHATDLAIKGTGLDLHVDRYYNSLADNVSGGWHIGNGWNVNVGCDVRLDIDDFDGLTLHMPDGYAALFRTSGSTWTTPAGLDATLVKNGDGTYTLTWHKNGEKFNFQTGGCLQGMVDQNGNTITMSYSGSLQSITDTQNRLTSFTYGSPVNSNYISKISDPSGRNLNYTYNSNGDLTTYGDTNSKNTQYSYNANDQLNQIIDPRGNTINFTYGTTYPYQLTQIGYVNTTCSGGSCNTSFTYNNGAGSCTSSGVFGNTVVTDANGHTTTYCYDNQGRVNQVIDAKGNKPATSYTSDNNVQTYADGANPNSPASFTYDPTTNNLTNVAQPTSANESWGYQKVQGDPQFYPDTYTDAQGNGYSYGYTSNNLTSVKNNSSGATWTATYNSNGTVASNKDANGNITSYTYDGLGNLTKITYPSPRAAVNMTYDTLSRMVTQTDGEGQKSTYVYDALDRLTQITYSDNSTITYTYDNDGNSTQLQDNTGTTTFTYDTMNRQTKKVLPGGTTMTYAYDGVGNLTSLQDPGGTMTYGYDQVNEVTSLQEPNATTTTFGYNAGYHRTSTSYPNGVGEAMTYDPSERLTQIKASKGATTLNSFTYSYVNPTTGKDSGVRWSVTDVNNNKTSYTYEGANRLTGTSGASSYMFGYDANGNMTNNNGAVQTFNGANELTKSASTTYTFDANGNETGSSAGLSFAYNPKNQTETINGLSMTYTGATQMERVTAGSTTFTYSVLGLASASGTPTTYFSRDNMGQLTEERLGPGSSYTPYYYLFDGLGAIVGMTDSSGSLARTYSYSPYGKQVSTTGTAANPWSFVSGYLDSQTNLDKFGLRFDDPSVGRWTQEDPQPNANLFIYAGNNPVNNVDPSGSDYIDLSLNIDLGIGLQAGLQIGDNGVVAPYVGAGVGLGGGLSGGVFSGEPSSGWTANVQACYGGCLGVSESEPSGADQLYWGFGTDAGISGTIDYTF